MGSGRSTRFLGALAILSSFVIAQGCGESNDTAGSTSDAEISTVSNAQAQRYEEGTPQHTALVWWRMAQLNEPELARTLYADPPTLPNLAGQFNFVEGQLAGTVRIASVAREGRQTIVTLVWKRPAGPSRRVSLQLEIKGGEPKIISAPFLDQIVQRLQRSAQDSDGVRPQGG